MFLKLFYVHNVYCANRISHYCLVILLTFLLVPNSVVMSIKGGFRAVVFVLAYILVTMPSSFGCWSMLGAMFLVYRCLGTNGSKAPSVY